MLDSLKVKFPGLYSWYQHLVRLRVIRETRRLSKIPAEKYPKMLSKIYNREVGHPLDWNNLVSYTEKMQWAKIYDTNPIKTELSDKYAVREWVKEKIGEEYLIPLLGVWARFDDIDFSKLPDKFVLKTNHGCSTIIIVKDKSKLNLKDARSKFNDWVRIDFGFQHAFEIHYSKIKPLIIAEEYLKTEYGQLQDYKFICFDGKPYFCWVDLGRYSHHTRNVFNMDWELQPWNQMFKKNYHEPIQKPKNFDKMVEIATILSKGFSHVRVDLYNVEGKIYFGEMTFTNGSGLQPINPVEYDNMLGDMWNLWIK